MACDSFVEMVAKICRISIAWEWMPNAQPSLVSFGTTPDLNLYTGETESMHASTWMY